MNHAISFVEFDFAATEHFLLNILFSQDVDEFLLLACDGVYDVMGNDELCEFVHTRLRVTEDLSRVANEVKKFVNLSNLRSLQSF